MVKNTFDIKKFSIELLNGCKSCQIKNYDKNEIITTYLVNRNMIYILLDGSADLIRYDFNGSQMIVEKYNKYDVFRRGFL